LLTVNKTGRNKGRKFYGCTFESDPRCKFFIWAEDSPFLIALVLENQKKKKEFNSTLNPLEMWQNNALETYTTRLEELTSQELKSEINTCKTRLRFTKDNNNTNKKTEEIYNNRLKNLKLSGTRSDLIDRLTKEAKYSLLNSNSMTSLPGISSSSSSSSSIAHKNVEMKNGNDDDEDGDDFINFSDDDEEENINSDNKSVDNSENDDESINDDDDDDVDGIDLSDSDDDYSSNNKKKQKKTKNIKLNQKDDNEDYDNETVTNDININNTYSSENNTVSNKIINILRCTFGYKNFRVGQQWAIERVLMELNSLLVIPTGSGKSLCYMLPSILLPGLTIVISPIIALMQDQVKKLPVLLPGVCLSGNMTTQEVASISSNILGSNSIYFTCSYHYYTNRMSYLSIYLFIYQSIYLSISW
jgi:hypothetical protein